MVPGEQDASGPDLLTNKPKMPSALLEIKDLTKYFGRSCIFQGVSLDIHPGEIFGLLGPNGAGKTTLIKCIFKFLKTSQGQILYRGKSLHLSEIHKNFGYLPENFLPPRELTGEEFLRILGLSLHLPYQDIREFLEKFGLEDKKKIKHYSRGMIQRLGLATALLKNPEFLILDEPTLGLDPVGQSKILVLLKNLNSQGKTIFFCSHNLFQVQSICDRIGIIHQGRMRFVGKIEEFLLKYDCASLEEAFLKEVQNNA